MFEKANTGGVVSAARITVRPEKSRELFLTMSYLLDRIRAEKGCRSYRFYREASHEDCFLLIGEWATPADWERHQHSEFFKVLLGSLGILGQEEGFEFKVLSLVGEIEAFTGKETKYKGAVCKNDSNETAYFRHA
jgi:quinol monooxygenase YgiN